MVSLFQEHLRVKTIHLHVCVLLHCRWGLVRALLVKCCGWMELTQTCPSPHLREQWPNMARYMYMYIHTYTRLKYMYWLLLVYVTFAQLHVHNVRVHVSGLLYMYLLEWHCPERLILSSSGKNATEMQQLGPLHFIDKHINLHSTPQCTIFEDTCTCTCTCVYMTSCICKLLGAGGSSGYRPTSLLCYGAV